ncbi:hypothetical protein [Nocardiopsis coralliicola]
MSPGTYWKRRVFVLVGLLAIVTLIVYACRPSASDDDPSGAAGSSPAASPTADAPSSVPPSASPDPSPSASPSPSEEASGEAGGGGGAGGDGDGGEDGGEDDSGGSGRDEGYPEPKKASDECRPSDIVLTVDTDKADYAWDGKPKLELKAVNTGDQTCTLDLGPDTVELRITSGDDRVFSTRDCAEAEDAEKTELERGVPAEHTVTWDRSRSWDDCRDSGAEAKRPGTYVVTAKGDYAAGEKTERSVFRLN